MRDADVGLADDKACRTGLIDHAYAVEIAHIVSYVSLLPAAGERARRRGGRRGGAFCALPRSVRVAVQA
jgi:hypothetical protein